MSYPNPTDQQIRSFFKEEGVKVTRLLKPLMELSSGSSTLILGYVGGSTREEMIPYFHVCGTGGGSAPLRALIVGGWHGDETTATYTIARLLAAIEVSLQLASGIEVTAYPVANLEASKAAVALTEAQAASGVTLWTDSSVRHAKVLEQELKRYDYDLVILLREDPQATEAAVHLWPNSPRAHEVLTGALDRYRASGNDIPAATNPDAANAAPVFTPVPGATRQPAEVEIVLAGKADSDEQAGQAMGLLLSFLHAMRQSCADRAA